MFDAPPARLLPPLGQSDGYARAMTRLGLAAEMRPLMGAAGPVGQMLVQTRRCPGLGRIGLISRGPVWVAPPDVPLLARDLAALGHPVVLNTDGLAARALKAAGFLPVMTAATVAQLDLVGDAAARRARMHQKWRNRLVRTENGPLRLRREEMPVDPGHWLLRAEAAQRRARRYRDLPAAFTLAFAEANPGAAQLFTAALAGEDVAAMLILRHGPTATYHIGHTTDAGRAHHAHTALLTLAADWLADQGVEMLELGLLDTVNAPGLARFKLGSGAAPHVLGGSWLYARWLAPLARL